MTREQVVAILRAHETELRAAGIVGLSLFSSTARGDRRPDSDIDLLAVFDDTGRISLLGVAGIELQLAQLLGQPVDLVEEGTLKPRGYREALRPRRFVPSKDPIQRFEDILENIFRIEELTAGMDSTTL